MDMRYMDYTAVASGDVTTYATGFRNPYGIAVRRDGSVIIADNGPNSGFGAAMTGLVGGAVQASSSEPTTEDSVYINVPEARAPMATRPAAYPFLGVQHQGDVYMGSLGSPRFPELWLYDRQVPAPAPTPPRPRMKRRGQCGGQVSILLGLSLPVSTHCEALAANVGPSRAGHVSRHAVRQPAGS